nr:hypothetical protein [Tanacetum cinerariifolium]
MSAMGELNFFLGLQVLQKKDVIFLSQDKYVGDILKKFGYSDVRSSNTPMEKEYPWGKDGTGKDVDLHLYRSMIGSLMYLTASRPDIMFAICACARHQVTPKECHLHTVKRIFRYLKGHPKLGLWYPKESLFDLVAYSDSDYGGATQDRKSTTRGCQFLAASGYGQVMWIQNQLLDYGIETTDEGTKILTTIDGKLRTISESSIRKNLKLKDEAGISSLPDAELFENLTLMGYNILHNQKFSFQKGTTTDPHHTPFPEAQQTSPSATSSPSLLPIITLSIPTVIPSDTPQLRQYTRRARVAQSSALPPVADEPASPIGDDSQGRSLDEGEEAPVERSTKRGSDDIEEMVTVLTSLDAASILTSEVSVSISPVTEVSVAEVPTGSGFIPTASPPGTIVPTGNGMVPTASPIFTTAIESTPYTKRKGKEKMVESDTPKKKKLQEQIDIQVAREIEEHMVREDQRRNKQIEKDAEIARIHAEEELHMMIDGLDRNNETIAKYLQEYHQPLCKSSQVLDSAKKAPLKEATKRVLYIQDFVPMGSKEEGERFKRKGLRLEQDSSKKVNTSEEVPEENLKEMMQLIPVEERLLSATITLYLKVEDPIFKEHQHHIKRLQAQSGDLEVKSIDTQCALDTLGPLSQRLEDENVSLEFQTIDLSKPVTSNLVPTTKESKVVKNDKVTDPGMFRINPQKDNTQDMSKNTKFAKQPNVEILPKIGEINALSKPVTSNSVSTPHEAKGVNNDKVIAPGMFRISPDKVSREAKKVPNTVSASSRTKPITVSQPSVITKKGMNSNSNGLSSTGIDNTKTRRPQPKSNTKNDRVPSASKSSQSKNKDTEVKDHHRNLLLSKNIEHISSACNNSKIDSQNVISKVVCAK